MTTVLAMIVMTDDEVAGYGRASDASFGALRTARGLLPLAAMDVDVRVAGVVASTEVAQTFVNTTGIAIEATYMFPLPDRAAVHRFRMEVAGRVIEGVIDERGMARERYEEAIQQGHRAAITEEERPGVFTMRVGNLMPGEAATVRLSLVGPLPVDDGAVTLRFPLVVAPRYMPGAGLGGDQAGLGSAADTSLVPDASRISPPVMIAGFPNPVRLGLRVAIQDRGIANVLSSLHAVTTSSRDAHVVEIQPGERLDRDFILRWRVDGNELRSNLACRDDADGRGGSFMLTLMPPNTQAVSAKPRDVVFVLDRSGSMGGWKMVAARRACARMIDTLTATDRFRVIAFDNVIECLPEATLVHGTDRNRFRAVEALAKVDARGGTELAHPLRGAASSLAGGTDDRERVIVLVTDGQVGNEDHILRELTPQLRNVRMFTLGIDQAVNAAFLRRLASAGGGLCELVESEDRLDEVMTKVHRRIGTPIVTDLALAGLGIDIDASTISPRKLPDVYAGAPVVIFGRYRGSAPEARVEVTGTSLGDPMRMSISRDIGVPSAPGGGSWLAASWARAHIRDLEDRYAAGAQQLEPTIVDVSKRFGVLSRFTAYVAIDRSEVVNRGGRLLQAVQPVEEPSGWGSAQSAPMAPASFGPPQGGGYAPRSNSAVASRPDGRMPLGRKGGAMPPPMPAMAPRPGPASMPMQPRPSFDADDVGESAISPPGAMRRAPSPGYAPAPSSPPPARHEPMPMLERERGTDGPSEVVVDPYLAKLEAFAHELQRIGQGMGNPSHLRVIRQRMTEWVEDIRSVGGRDDLAAAVEALIARLSAALASATAMTEVIAIAAALQSLADGTPPPAAPPKTRVAFWK